MKCNEFSAAKHRSKRASGMTLVQMMVAVAVGCLVLAMMGTIFLTTTCSLTAVGNYVTMDQASRNALDQMSRDIRKAQTLISYSTNQLVFNYAGTTNLVYEYDPDSRTLSQWKTGDSATNYLLTGCQSLQFSVYNSVPQPGGTFLTATNVSQAKCVSVAWQCSRMVLGKQTSTEQMQQALIVIRNKPIL
jgi:hypothetical protein